MSHFDTVRANLEKLRDNFVDGSFLHALAAEALEELAAAAPDVKTPPPIAPKTAPIKPRHSIADKFLEKFSPSDKPGYWKRNADTPSGNAASTIPLSDLDEF